MLDDWMVLDDVRDGLGHEYVYPLVADGPSLSAYCPRPYCDDDGPVISYPLFCKVCEHFINESLSTCPVDAGHPTVPAANAWDDETAVGG